MRRVAVRWLAALARVRASSADSGSSSSSTAGPGASAYGGGGHKNAAGFTAKGPLDKVKPEILARVKDAIEAGIQTRPG